MPMKRKDYNGPMNLRYSWEEEAFAEDGRGPLGGFVWPPRSYSCSFCRREFRSAQALRGHTNVHRRAKAKLNQPVNNGNFRGTTLAAPQNHNQESVLCLDPTAGLFPSLGEEVSVDHSSSDAKSCVHDEDLWLIGLDMGGGGGGGGKRRKTNHVMMQGGLDLELRLASFQA